uniref:Uncharacterized protein n=1 Tax=Dulem virus 36 TaxID=3145754 RepID=A0AAU8AZF1_9CAUD
MNMYLIIYFRSGDEESPAGRFFIIDQTEIKAIRRFCKITESRQKDIKQVIKVKNRY